MKKYRNYPFTAIVGQEDMKTALILNVVNPALGGVLIRGEKGTAKSTAVRALAELMPKQEAVLGCAFGCDPHDEALCVDCMDKRKQGAVLEAQLRPMQVVDLPVSATEDRVVGTIDIEHALKHGEKRFESGILGMAHRNILYVDEVNLLDDHVVDVLLDSAAMGVNTIEREGVSYSHPARFTLVGTMNPEEGDLRPQLLDRFGLVVDVMSENDSDMRVRVLERRLAFESDPDKFIESFESDQKALAQKISSAQKALRSVTYLREILLIAAKLAIAFDVNGHRADISMIKTAVTLTAYDGRTEVTVNDVRRAAAFVLPHRMRRKPFEKGVMELSDIDAIIDDETSGKTADIIVAKA